MIFYNHPTHLLSLILCIVMLTNCSDDDTYRNPQVNITNTPVYNTQNIPVAESFYPQTYAYYAPQAFTYNEAHANASTEELARAELVMPKESQEKKSLDSFDNRAQGYFDGNYTFDDSDDDYNNSQE